MEEAIKEIIKEIEIKDSNQLLRNLIYKYPKFKLTFNDTDKVNDILANLRIQLPTYNYGSKEERRSLYDIYANSIIGNDEYAPICSSTTRDECTDENCLKVHFKPILRSYTDPQYGHCSYLNTCYPFYQSAPPALSNAFSPTGAVIPKPHTRSSGDRICKYLHFEVEIPPHEVIEEVDRMNDIKKRRKTNNSNSDENVPSIENVVGNKFPAQFINCDLRRFDYNTLGKFQVIVADPPWDIHMSLPYGTLTDDEMRNIPMSSLSEEGTLIFLWVTGRAMDLGRECLSMWGFKRVEEITWVKINQLQRLIRTGRTGHWLNHTKEHCLVGIKSSTDEIEWPPWLYRGIDCDVIVSEVRETSRKPDELYGIIERCCPGGRKVELFGRRHNGRHGWLTLGNQIGDDQVYDPQLASRLNERYPDKHVKLMK